MEVQTRSPLLGSRLERSLPLPALTWHLRSGRKAQKDGRLRGLPPQRLSP